MATDRIVASGFARSLPAMSGAEPCTGSYMPGFPGSPSEADGSMPIEPVIWPASSDRISPNMFVVTTTSKSDGRRISCIEALSTYMWSSATSGYSAATRTTTSRQTRELSRTLALSTLVSFFRRPRASSKPTRAMRSTSPTP